MSKSILVIDTPKSCMECRITCKEFDVEFLNESNDLGWFSDNVLANCPLQDTTELLEALETIGNQKDTYGRTKIKHYTNLDEPYKKLHKALGGLDE